MTTYTCPRCGHPSTAERCGTCGRGPEPLLARLGELDTVLAAMPATLQSRAAVEAERRGVLDGLTQVAARHLAEAERQARTGPSPAAPAATPATPPGTTPPGATPPGTPNAGPEAQGTPPRAPQGAPAYAGAPLPPHTPPGGVLPPAGYAAPAPERGEVGSKTVQTVLLSLGGLLVAAAIIIFTAVAWRNLGNGGRAAILGGATVLLLAVPFACKRFKLWATAETFAALGALALWCTTLAGYYLYRPPGADFGPETVGAWTAAVLAVLAVYRAATRLTAVSWALLPLALVGASFAAASPLGLAVTLMLTVALALGAAAWITGNRPGRFIRSDLWASRFLTCAAVVAACSAGLRAAFGLDDPVVPPVAAAVALLAAANLAGVHFSRRLGVSPATFLVAASAAGSLVLAAWVLAIRSDAGELVVPSLALLAAAILVFVPLGGRENPWPFAAPAAAGLASLAVFAAVAFDAPDLSAYFVAFLAARLVAPLTPDPFGRALRYAAYLVGVGTAAVAGVIATIGAVIVLLQPGLGWSVHLEVPVVLTAFAIAAVLLPRRFRVNAATLAVSLAVASAAVRLWSEDPVRYDAVPTLGFMACGLIALTSAIASGTVAGRCTGWASLAVWTAITAGAASASETMHPGDGWIPFWVTVTAAVMLDVAMGAPRRSRPDRVLAGVLAHVLAGASVFAGLVEWLAWSIEGSSAELFPAAQLGVYTLALVGAAMMAPFRKWGYAIAALCTGTLAWWALLAAQDVTTVELFTAPPAAVLFLIGLWRLERRPEAGSWAALALPVLIGIGPSLLMALGDGEPARRVGVGAAAIAVILAGLYRRWQAPLVLGSIALAVLTVNELTLLWHLIPVWIPPAIGGAILIGAGATFEKRRRDLARIRDGLKTMR